ncbi:polyprenyl synthetase family protein [Nocardia sp. NPDC005746]|uniref:polyprenyl synthetase family protein n=1 Tax=Nocardia sp. NPDC005746 TaxID=3157062 RepID=UPI0033F88D55
MSGPRTYCGGPRPLLRVAFDTLPSELRLMADYHVGWCDANGVVAEGESGRGLRPALVLAAAAALDAEPAAAVHAEPAAAVHAAAAVEMVHNFTVIHDDIVEGGTVRRGRPTVWQLWGVDDAVLVGDALHSRAIWTLADAPATATLDSIARLADVVIELCLGRHHDRAQEGSGSRIGRARRGSHRACGRKGLGASGIPAPSARRRGHAGGTSRRGSAGPGGMRRPARSVSPR